VIFLKRKQKVVLFSIFRKNGWEAVRNTLTNYI
jgi:hypothetical protein